MFLSPSKEALLSAMVMISTCSKAGPFQSVKQIYHHINSISFFFKIHIKSIRIIENKKKNCPTASIFHREGCWSIHKYFPIRVSMATLRGLREKEGGQNMIENDKNIKVDTFEKRYSSRCHCTDPWIRGVFFVEVGSTPQCRIAINDGNIQVLCQWHACCKHT